MSEQNRRSEELFETLSKNKKQRKRRLVRNVVIVIAVIAVILVAAVSMLRKNVEQRFAAAAAEVQAYSVTTGTIHTTVSGSGVLTEVDLEAISVPEGVEVREVNVEAGETVQQGDLLATLDMSTVMTALSDLQEEMAQLDDELNSVKGETVSASITAGVSGRVKRILAEKDMDVSACMAEHGALAVLSLDGYMAAELETEALKKGDTVSVIRENGAVLQGKVDSAAGGKATVLVTDNGPKFDEEVTVTLTDGTELGKAALYIHNPLAVTGYAGTIQTINTQENAKVGATSTLFRLKNTSFSANYDTLLRQRAELEETLLELLTLYRDGALLAPMDGVVSSVEFEAEDTAATTTSSMTSAYSSSAYMAYYGMSGASTASASTSAPAEVEGTAVLTLYPDLAMSITISIDETDILALQEGQEAEVEVSSVSEDLFPGTVTKISKTADTSAGVTQYSAEITLDKAPGMLSGMTASVDVKIQGVENAIIIPVEALHQTSTSTFVYTQYDEETKLYGGMVDVTTGMQNDTQVEILSGLNVGDTVYYTHQEDFFSMISSMMGMGGGNMGGSPGQMPNRGR